MARLCVALLVLGVGLAAAAPPPLPNVGSGFGMGINILLANPDDLAAEDAFGPRVFALTYEQGRTTPDNRFALPDGTEAEMFPEQCNLEVESTALKSGFAYQDGLLKNYEASTGFLFGWFSFTKSARFAWVEDFTLSNLAYMTHAKAECNTYTISYDTYSQQPALDATFARVLASLPDKFQLLNATCMEAFRTFLTTYGTHVATKVQMGGKAEQWLSVDVSDFQVLESQQIDVSEQAKIGFLIAVGESAHGQENTTAYLDFKSNSTGLKLLCQGGDPSLCLEGQASFGNWSQTVAKSPLAKDYKLMALHELATSANFPNVSNIAAIAQALKAATEAYILSDGKVPYETMADVGGVENHDVSLSHRLQALPTLSQVSFAVPLDADNAVLFPLAPSFHPCQTAVGAQPPGCQGTLAAAGNPANLLSAASAIDVAISAAGHLRSTFNAETMQWSNYSTGYWTLRTTAAAPAFDSGWVEDWAGSSHVSALPGTLPADTAFLQISFAETSSPDVLYPLEWRHDHLSGPNPVSIEVENGTVKLHVNGSQPLFATNDNALNNTAYQSGFWKAAAFGPPPNASAASFFDSGFFALEQLPGGGVSLFKDFAHGFGAAPELVAVWFSPIGDMSHAFPVTFAYQGAQRSNPATVQMDSENILLHFAMHAGGNVFSAWQAGNGWLNFTPDSAYWRVVALKDITAFES